MNLHSTIGNKGKLVTEVIHFNKGNKRTITGILTDTIKQGEFTKFETTDGRMILVNTANVDLIEVFGENE